MADPIKDGIELAPREAQTTLRLIVVLVTFAVACIGGSFWIKSEAEALVDRRLSAIRQKGDLASFYVQHTFDDIEEIRASLGLARHRHDDIKRAYLEQRTTEDKLGIKE